jgi:predicted nucleic acid-binding Zn ribbon protein
VTWEPLPDRDSGVKDLSSVLGRLHTTMGLARPDTVRLLERHWTSLLGAELAPRCRLEAVRGTELVVSVDDPAVAEHLRWSARDLCSAVNAVCAGDVVDELTVRVRRAGS